MSQTILGNAVGGTEMRLKELHTLVSAGPEGLGVTRKLTGWLTG